MRKEHTKTLVLNADYTAVGIVSVEKVMTLQCKDRIALVDFYKDDYIMGANGQKYPIPAVVALKQYINPNKRKVPFSRKNVFIRDKLTCMYCGCRLSPKRLTYDHVIPRSKWDIETMGTPTKWENIVTACIPCNNKKADLTLDQCKMSLIKKPVQPSPIGYVLGLSPWTHIQEEWEPYIPQNYLDYCNIVNNEDDSSENKEMDRFLR